MPSPIAREAARACCGLIFAKVGGSVLWTRLPLETVAEVGPLVFGEAPLTGTNSSRGVGGCDLGGTHAW